MAKITLDWACGALAWLGMVFCSAMAGSAQDGGSWARLPLRLSGEAGGEKWKVFFRRGTGYRRCRSEG